MLFLDLFAGNTPQTPAGAFFSPELLAQIQAEAGKHGWLASSVPSSEPPLPTAKPATGETPAASSSTPPAATGEKPREVEGAKVAGEEKAATVKTAKSTKVPSAVAPAQQKAVKGAAPVAPEGHMILPVYELANWTAEEFENQKEIAKRHVEALRLEAVRRDADMRLQTEVAAHEAHARDLQAQLEQARLVHQNEIAQLHAQNAQNLASFGAPQQYAGSAFNGATSFVPSAQKSVRYTYSSLPQAPIFGLPGQYTGPTTFPRDNRLPGAPAAPLAPLHSQGSQGSQDPQERR